MAYWRLGPTKLSMSNLYRHDVQAPRQPSSSIVQISWKVFSQRSDIYLTYATDGEDTTHIEPRRYHQ